MIRRKKLLNTRGEISNLWIIDQLKLGESYTSLILGVFVVIIATILLVTFVKGRGIQQSISSQILAESTQDASKLNDGESAAKTKTETDNTYTVARGDTLWSIAEKKYKSGFMWVEIAKANNLSNPDLVFAENKLKIPQIQEKQVAKTNDSKILASSSSINESNYVVQKNDYLWDIAVRAYGDGYKWTEIAKANNLANPNLIFSGDSLKIPRNT